VITRNSLIERFSRRRVIQTGAAVGVATAAPTLTGRSAGVRAQETTEIRVAYHVWAGWEDALKAIIADFESKNPTIKVSYELIDYPQLETVLTPQFAAQDPPDLVISNGNFPWAAQGLLLDLRDRIAADNVDLSLIADTLVFGRVLGQEAQLGLPVYLTGGLVFYNKTLFDQYCVQYPAKGWTMDDFRAAAIALTRDGEGRSPADSGFDSGSIAHYGVYFSGGQNTEPFVRNFGGHFFNEDYTEALLTDPASVEAFSFLSDLACAQHALISPEPGVTPPNDAFVSQQAAMMINGEWMFSLYNTIPDFDWDVAPPPQGAAGYPDGYHVYAASDTMGIAKDSQHPDQAWAFLKHLVFDLDSQLNVAGSLGPVLKEAGASPEFLAKRSGERGPSQENVVWSYEEMGAHSAYEYYLGTTKNGTQWGPVYQDFERNLLTLCTEVNGLLEEYDTKLTDAINSTG
jgi:multiple sugar transport system substrate-binding protein